jgi:hypothetical protein
MDFDCHAVRYLGSRPSPVGGFPFVWASLHRLPFHRENGQRPVPDVCHAACQGQQWRAWRGWFREETIPKRNPLRRHRWRGHCLIFMACAKIAQ